MIFIFSVLTELVSRIAIETSTASTASASDSDVIFVSEVFPTGKAEWSPKKEKEDSDGECYTF